MTTPTRDAILDHLRRHGRTRGDKLRAAVPADDVREVLDQMVRDGEIRRWRVRFPELSGRDHHVPTRDRTSCEPSEPALDRASTAVRCGAIPSRDAVNAAWVEWPDRPKGLKPKLTHGKDQHPRLNDKYVAGLFAKRGPSPVGGPEDDDQSSTGVLGQLWDAGHGGLLLNDRHPINPRYCKFCKGMIRRGECEYPDQPWQAEWGKRGCQCSACIENRLGWLGKGQPPVHCGADQCRKDYQNERKDKSRDAGYAAHRELATEVIREHPDWTDKQVAAELDIRPKRVKEARKELGALVPA